MNDTNHPPAALQPAIEIRNLSVVKGGNRICSVPELVVSPGQRVGIIGANGCGKTTLLRILAGFEDDFSGTCQIEFDRLARVCVHQSPCLFRGTVLQNVGYGLAARSIPRAERKMLSLEWLGRLGISGLADRNVKGLSGGEQRRVALARACVLKPRLLLLDEPLADLDMSGIESVRRALADLSESTILIASPTSLPEGMVDRVARM